MESTIANLARFVIAIMKERGTKHWSVDESDLRMVEQDDILFVEEKNGEISVKLAKRQELEEYDRDKYDTNE